MKRLFPPCTNLAAFLFAGLCLVTSAVWAQELSKQNPPAAAADKALQVPDLSSADLAPKVVEDFSTPALTKGTVLGSIEGLEIENDEDPMFTREVVRVMWRGGDPIDLYVLKPVGVKKPPVILYLFDYPTETDQYRKAEFCRLLTKEGFAAVGFVPALTGQRYHDRPMKEWFVSELRESLASSAHDVQMVLNYLTARADVDMSRVGMFGDGSGASIAILAAAVDPRIKTLDLLDPWGDWPDWIKESKRIPEKERPDYLKPEWLAGVAPLDPVKWLPELKARKVRIQFVKDIAVTPADVQAKIGAAVPQNAQILRYENTAAFNAAVAGGAGFDWIKQHVGGSTPKEYHAARQSRPKNATAESKNSQQ